MSSNLSCHLALIEHLAGNGSPLLVPGYVPDYIIHPAGPPRFWWQLFRPQGVGPVWGLYYNIFTYYVSRPQHMAVGDVQHSGKHGTISCWVSQNAGGQVLGHHCATHSMWDIHKKDETYGAVAHTN
ncbi:hypothetical protein CHUAL_009643 [Chamberlinius hualienensis]